MTVTERDTAGQGGTKFLSRADLADFLRVKPETVRKWHQRGTGPSYRRIGRHVLYERSEVMAFIEASPRIGRSLEAAKERDSKQRTCPWECADGEICGRVCYGEVCPDHQMARRAKLQRERSAKARTTKG